MRSVLLAAGLLLACVTATAAASGSPWPSSTGAAAHDASVEPLATATPTPTPAASPAPSLTGTWAGVLGDTTDLANRVTLSLHDCVSVGEAGCGSLEVRRADGVGCVFWLEQEWGPIYSTHNGNAECPGSVWWEVELNVRAAPDGSLVVSSEWVTFTLQPAPAPEPIPVPRATADRATVIAGQTIAIDFSAFAPGSVSITLEQAVTDLGRSDLGTGTVVVRIPAATPTGRQTVWVEGMDWNSWETGVSIRLTVVHGSVPPSTDTVVASPTRGLSLPLLAVLVVVALLAASLPTGPAPTGRRW